MAVIHVESFEKEVRERTKYSISTKIAESLTYGPCLFAYGPRGIASIDYLCQYNSAIVATSKDELVEKLSLIGNSSYRKDTMNRARDVAKMNHNTIYNGKMIKNIFEKSIQSYGEK